LRDTSKISAFEPEILPFLPFFFFLGNLGPVWPLGGSTEPRVTRDTDQSSWSTGGCVTRDCRFERNCTVWDILNFGRVSLELTTRRITCSRDQTALLLPPSTISTQSVLAPPVSTR
jgi:hypothetical protein